MALRHLYRGKVRDIYEVDAEHLLLVASDRISVFDVVLPEPVPDKGRVLTAITTWWLDEMRAVAPSHLVSVDPADFPAVARDIDGVAGRGMLVRRADMLKIECIVRGYLSGSAWKEYRASGTMHGTPLPEGLEESAQLPEPVFTPSTKADEGHDENITFDAAAAIVGDDVAARARAICLEVYAQGAARAAERGIIIADTKFELGFIDGELAICDEVLTPDSSRFWDAADWSPGSTPPSFDKQPVRDWAEATGWDKKPPPPHVPDDVVRQSRERYVTAYERLTGKRLGDWFGAGE
jgi:phosphoribosylaminoimidazole-succinocarboxamide synthase